MKGLISQILEAILQNNFVHGLDGVVQSVEQTSIGKSFSTTCFIDELDKATWVRRLGATGRI